MDDGRPDPPLNRRRLLGVSAAAGLAVAVAGCREPDRPPAAASAPRLDPGDWSSVRAQFALNPDTAHLSTFVFAAHPAAVRAAIDEHRRGLDADPVGYLHGNEGRLDEAVWSAASAYLATPAERIALTDSTTMGLGLLYTGLRLRVGDEVLTTEHDFYATHESLRLRAARDGVTVRRVRLYDDPAAATPAGIASAIRDAVTARTAVVAITWVHSSTGVRLPVREIADAVRGRNPDALLCVDGVHGLGAVDATPDQLGCDFLVSGCHKWLFGPRGTGLLWGSPRGWARFTPVIPTFDPRAFGGPGGSPAGPAATPGGYQSFEHRWALAEAFALHERVGRARIAARTAELATALKAGLAASPRVRLVTPFSAEMSAGIVCCEVDGVPPQRAVSRLREAKVVATVTPYNPSYLRFGPSVLNTPADVDTAVRAVRDL